MIMRCFGGDEEDRTPDLTDANRTLSRMVRFSPVRVGGLTALLFDNIISEDSLLLSGAW